MRNTQHDNRQTIILTIGLFAVAMVVLFGVVIPYIDSVRNTPPPSGTTIINIKTQPTAVANCDLSKYNYLGIPIPPMAPGTQQVIDIPNVGKLTLTCGTNGGEATGSIQQAPTAAPAVAPKRSCITPDGFTILDGGSWKEGVQAYVCQDGAKVPVGSAPATPQPTLIAAPTAAPVQFNCPASFVKNGAVGNALPHAEAQKDGTTDIYLCTVNGWQWARTAPVAP